MDTDRLRRIILDSEDILIEKILDYALERDYSKYTSTLKEAWGLSISGLSEALATAIGKNRAIPEMGPDDDFSSNGSAAFGISEARKHRSRGITIGMFLGLMKYYCQAYTDLIEESAFTQEEKKYFSQYIIRYFDHVELGFITEWEELSEKNKLEELQKINRDIVNEKNKYLTVFESIYDPVILVGRDNGIENVNQASAAVFLGIVASGTKYYGNAGIGSELDWLNELIVGFSESDRDEDSCERTIETTAGERTFIIKFRKMLDVSEKYGGTVISFNDITDRLRIESELNIYREKLEYYAFTDPMTGVSNRRTGILMLEKELALACRNGTPLSICFIDVDGLKKVNDLYGHSEGDCLINHIASSLKTSVREIDTVSRMGGDEFLIVFPGCFKADAEEVVGRISRHLEKYDLKGKKPYRHSFSYGIIGVSGNASPNVNEMIIAADEAMYQNKLSKTAS